MSSFQLKIFRGTTGLNDLKEDWYRLLENIASPTVQHDWRWYMVLAEHLFGDALLLCAIYANEQITAIFPLWLRRRTYAGMKLRSLEHPSHPKFIWLYDVLIHQQYTDAGLLAFVLDELQKTQLYHWDVFRCEQFSERSLFNALAEVRSQTHSWGIHTTYMPCNSERALQALSKKHIRNVRRYIRNAEKDLGPVSLEIHPDGSFAEIYSDFLRIEDAGWKSSTGTGSSIKASGSTAQAFYASLYTKMHQTDDARIIFLRIGHERVATAFLLRSGTIWNLCKIGFNEQYSSFSPGNIMLLLLLEYAARQTDIAEVNLMTGPAWADRWHMSESEIRYIVIYSGTLRSQYMKMLRLINRIKQRIEIKLG